MHRLSLAILMIVLPGWVLQAAPEAELLDHRLGAVPYQVRLMSWEQGAALSVLAIRKQDDLPAELLLVALALEAGGWREIGRWEAPRNTRYAEPLRLRGGARGWLAFDGVDWRLAVYTPDGLRWSRLCRCPTLYSPNYSPHPEESRLVADLDGDGADEVVLPYASHLEGYRPLPGSGVLEPLWRLYWNGDRKPLPPQSEQTPPIRVPPHHFIDVQGDGAPEVVIDFGDHAGIAAPPEKGESGYRMDGRKKALALGGALRKPPEDLRARIQAMSEDPFADAEAFLGAFTAGVSAERLQAWRPHLTDVLRVARDRLPAGAAYRADYPNLGPFDPKRDEYRVLAMTDMDGDRLLDVLHVKIVNAESKRSRENQLRWFRGRMDGGRLGFMPPQVSLRTDAGSFADVIYPRSDGSRPLALLVASTEVSFGAIMRALATGRVTLEASILGWKEGALDTAARSRREFTYEGLTNKGRRAMFLAADLDGDGVRDYLLNLKEDAVAVILSAGGPTRLDAATLELRGLTLPSRPERVLVTDLDRDGREELIAWYRGKYHGDLGMALRAVRLKR